MKTSKAKYYLVNTLLSIINPVWLLVKLLRNYLPIRIASKYIFNFNRSFNFINIITLMSLLGITVGIAALITVMSIFNGFKDFTENQLIGFDPHIRIAIDSQQVKTEYQEILEDLRANHLVKSASPLLQARVIGIKNTSMQAVMLNCYSPDELHNVSGVSESIVIGRFSIETENGFPKVIIGAGLADRLSVLPLDTISLISAEMLETSIRTYRQYSGINVVVSGIFQLHDKEYDDLYIFASNELADRLFRVQSSNAEFIDVKLHKVDDVNKLKKSLIKKYKDISILTWYDLHADLYNIMRFERMVVFIVLSLIIVIAGFNLLASISMTVVEKKSDIAVLRAIGAERKTIRNIFIAEGTIIGLMSVIYGTILGLALCYAQINFGIFKLDTSKYLIPAIPVSIEYVDIAIIILFATTLSFLSTIYPAKRATNTNIIEQIRDN